MADQASSSISAIRSATLEVAPPLATMVATTTPRPTSSGWVSAICATTKARCRRDRVAATVDEEPFSTSPTETRVTCSAGETPKTTPVTRATANVAVETFQSTTSCTSSTVVAANRIPRIVRKRPTAAATRARSTLSVRSCRTTRSRGAPSARRTAISRRRETARPTRSALTVVQVTSRTSSASAPANAAESSRSARLLTRLLLASIGTTSAPPAIRRSLAAPTCPARTARSAMPATIGVAVLGVTPGRSRPTALRNMPSSPSNAAAPRSWSTG